MIVLDTNVISEMAKPAPLQSSAVAAWLETQDIGQLWITSVTYAELLAGLYAMPDGRRRQGLIDATDAVVLKDLGGRVLEFGIEAARAFAEIAVERRSKGRSTNTADVQIAAIALMHGVAVATRNVADFGAKGLVVINPWDHPTP